MARCTPRRSPRCASRQPAQDFQRPLSERYRVRRADGSFRWVVTALRRGSTMPASSSDSSAAASNSEDEPQYRDRTTARRHRTARQRIARSGLPHSRLVPSPSSTSSPATFAGSPVALPRTLTQIRRRCCARFARRSPRSSTARRRRGASARDVHARVNIRMAASWTEDRCRPVRSARGAGVAIEGVARDVTQRLDAERALTQSEEQLRQLTAESRQHAKRNVA